MEFFTFGACAIIELKNINVIAVKFFTLGRAPGITLKESGRRAKRAGEILRYVLCKNSVFLWKSKEKEPAREARRRRFKVFPMQKQRFPLGSTQTASPSLSQECGLRTSKQAWGFGMHALVRQQSKAFPVENPQAAGHSLAQGYGVRTSKQTFGVSCTCWLVFSKKCFPERKP